MNKIDKKLNKKNKKFKNRIHEKINKLNKFYKIH